MKKPRKNPAKTPDLFALSLSNRQDFSIARAWLLIGITALAFAGLYAIVLVAARTPGVQNLFPYADFFRTALVVHVDLSVLVWLLSFCAVLWTAWHAGSYTTRFSRAAILAAALGLAAMAASPFAGEGLPLLNNYVPLLQQPVFIFGLTLFCAAIAYEAIFCAATRFATAPLKTPIGNGIFGTMLIALLALLAFVISYYALSHNPSTALLDPVHYYEKLFWAAGHILQFAYTQAAIVAWLWLAQIIGVTGLPSATLAIKLLWANVALAALGIAGFYFPIEGESFRQFYTEHMRWCGGIISIVFMVYIGVGWLSKPLKTPHAALRNALLTSLVLFASGGILGFLISGVNVVIPAHYHGSIVGVSIAFMGLTYALLPLLGYTPVTGKMAAFQPLLYGGGQLLHIAGLAWSGGYGALRKTPGAVDSFAGQMGMGLMGLGGLFSMIGGLLFVLIAYTSVYRSFSR